MTNVWKGLNDKREIAMFLLLGEYYLKYTDHKLQKNNVMKYEEKCEHVKWKENDI